MTKPKSHTKQKRFSKWDEFLEVCDRATEGPWVWTLTKQTKRVDVLKYFADMYDKRDEGALHGCGVAAPGHKIEEECLSTAITGNGPTSESNAQFVAQSRELAPEAARIARAAEEWSSTRLKHYPADAIQDPSIIAESILAGKGPDDE